MKLRALLILSFLALSSSVILAKPDKRKEKSNGSKVERTIVTEANVTVSVCMVSGTIRVRGWDRNEVRARSSEAAEITFQREGDGPAAKLARKIKLLIADEAQDAAHPGPCESFSELELDVPRGATVDLKARDGDIDVDNVAMAYVNTQNGAVTIERATKAVDAGTIGGDILLRDSSGSIKLHSVGGSIDANNVRPSQIGDTFEAKSLGGDITLEGVSHAHLMARTLNGDLRATGPLAKGGRYDLQTNSGDLTLTMPESASFKVTARFSQNVEIISDFPLTMSSFGSAPPDLPKPPVAPPGPAPKAEAVPKPAPPSGPDDDTPVVKVKTDKYGKKVSVNIFALRRIEGTHGGGDATIELSSFSGTIHLRKQ